jgi:hypothetical protein
MIINKIEKNIINIETTMELIWRVKLKIIIIVIIIINNFFLKYYYY